MSHTKSLLTVVQALARVACVVAVVSLATAATATPLSVDREMSDSAGVDVKHNSVRRHYENFVHRKRTCLEQPLESRERHADVILTGTVRTLEVDGKQQVARVEIKRLLKGADQFADVDFYSRKLVLIGGIGDPKICHSRAYVHDSFIFLASRHGNGRYGDDAQTRLRLNSSLVRLTLRNIEEIELLVKQGRRQRVEAEAERQEENIEIAARVPVLESGVIADISTSPPPPLPSTTHHHNHHHQPPTDPPPVHDHPSTVVQPVDPCSTLACTHGAVCVTSDDGLTGHCQCPRMHCDEKEKDGDTDGPVCGTDGEDYSSECEMRHASCRLMKHIGKKYDGYCDSCRDKQCQFHAVCVSDGVGGSQCVCPSKSTCESNNKDDGADSMNICGSDGHKYGNECEMQVTSCIQRKHITSAELKLCDPCIHVQCTKRHQQCIKGQCVCPPTVCPTIYEPVCGTDLVTYPNQCTLDAVSCAENLNIETQYHGACTEDELGSGTDVLPVAPVQVLDAKAADSPATSHKCDDSLCHHGAVCQSIRHGQQCVCQFNCEAIRSAVCGSDGKIYPNECQMKAEACNKQIDIRTQPLDNCEDIELEVEVCDGRPSLVNPRTGRQYNCDHESCPSGSYCHKVPHVASRCCHGDEAGTSAKGCETTEFRCCPDGQTAALGPKHAGCPSECQCNALGSDGLTCHPVTGQCTCKFGVGGLRCDRCEASYWGLQHIGTDGRTGCTPCACDMFGSVRDDCDQMTGKCLCRPGITGHKCSVCSNGSRIGPQGCIGQDNLQNDVPAVAATKGRSCSTPATRCRYGAVCDVTRCVCPDVCEDDVNSSGPVVCGSDGVTHKSRCYLRLASCRRQKPIYVVHPGPC